MSGGELCESRSLFSSVSYLTPNSGPSQPRCAKSRVVASGGAVRGQSKEGRQAGMRLSRSAASPKRAVRRKTIPRSPAAELKMKLARLTRELSELSQQQA